MQDYTTGGSCGFGYVTFDTEQAVDDLLAKGNKVELAGAQVNRMTIKFIAFVVFVCPCYQQLTSLFP